MNVVLTQIAAAPTEKYPYNFRVEINSDQVSDYERIKDWLTDNNISCTTMPVYELESWVRGMAIYVNTNDAIKISLRWS